MSLPSQGGRWTLPAWCLGESSGWIPDDLEVLPFTGIGFLLEKLPCFLFLFFLYKCYASVTELTLKKLSLEVTQLTHIQKDHTENMCSPATFMVD